MCYNVTSQPNIEGIIMHIIATSSLIVGLAGFILSLRRARAIEASNINYFKNHFLSPEEEYSPTPVTAKAILGLLAGGGVGAIIGVMVSIAIS